MVSNYHTETVERNTETKLKLTFLLRLLEPNTCRLSLNLKFKRDDPHTVDTEILVVVLLIDNDNKCNTWILSLLI